MDKYENVKSLGTWMHPEAGFPCVCFYDDLSRDWYELRKSWTGAVIAVWPDDNNLVGSFCWKAEDYLPVVGQTLFEVDPKDVPNADDVMKLLGCFTFDGKTFKPFVPPEAPLRTKEDIMADLLKLQEELKAM